MSKTNEAQAEYEQGNPVDTDQQFANQAVAMEVHDNNVPMVNLGPCGTGKTYRAKLFAGLVGALGRVTLNATDIPTSVLKGMRAPDHANPDSKEVKVYLQDYECVPIRHHWSKVKRNGKAIGLDATILWHVDEIGTATQQTQDTILDLSDTDSALSRVCMPNLAIYMTANRAGIDGSSSQRLRTPFVNRGKNITSNGNVNDYLHVLSRSHKSSPEYLLANAPFTLKNVLALKKELAGPKGGELMARSPLFGWVQFEHNIEAKAKGIASEQLAKCSIFDQNDGHRGQQICSFRSAAYAMKEALLDWSSDPDGFEIMLRGYLGHKMADRAIQYIKVIRKSKNEVKKYINGDDAVLPSSPAEQYQFCLAAVAVLQETENLDAALHIQEATGWFTKRLLLNVDREIGKWSFDLCQLRGIDVEQVESLATFK